MDGILGQDVELLGLSSVQSCTPCMTSGKPISKSTSSRGEYELSACESAMSLGGNRQIRAKVHRLNDCQSLPGWCLGRVLIGSVGCRIQRAALQKGEGLSVPLETTHMSVISSFCQAN